MAVPKTPEYPEVVTGDCIPVAMGVTTPQTPEQRAEEALYKYTVGGSAYEEEHFRQGYLAGFDAGIEAALEAAYEAALRSHPQSRPRDIADSIRKLRSGGSGG